MAPKKKGQKMDLSAFLADTATGNWADEMEDIPIAPTVKDPNALKRGDPGYFDSIPDRGASRYPTGPGAGGDRGGREELPLPTKPPYTAFVGNLAFETEEEDLGMFFEGLETVSTKIIKGHDDKPKGFGYVEFTSLDGLKAGLERTGGQMQGRTVRVSVAEPPKSGGFGGGFGGPSMAESTDQWRRAGPLPPRSPTRATPSRTFSSNRFEGSDAGGPPAADRDWGAARGSKFTSNADAPAPARRESGFGLGGARPEGGFGGARDGAPREQRDRGPVGATPLAETPDDWRTNRAPRPAAPPSTAPVTLGREAPRGDGAKARGGFMEREPVVLSGQAAEETWSRGSKFAATEPPAPRPEPVRKESAPAPAPRPELEGNNWRSSKPASKEPTPTSSAQASPHPSRAQPRVTSPKVEGEEKPSRIGGDWRSARPEKKVEETPKPVEGEAPPARGEPSNQRGPPMNRGGLAAAGGNFPRNMPSRRGQSGPGAGGNAGGSAEGGWRRGPSAPAPVKAATPPPQQPTQPKQKAVAEPVVDEDGFTVASGSAARRQAGQQVGKPSENKNESSENRNKFSFASANGMDDFVQGTGDEETEDVTKKVNDVQI